jgi:hypothetical protein
MADGDKLFHWAFQQHPDRILQLLPDPERGENQPGWARCSTAASRWSPSTRLRFGTLSKSPNSSTWAIT